LKQEYAALEAEKKKQYAGYHEIKKQNQDLLAAKHNAARLLNIKPEAQSREVPPTKPHAEAPEL